jgi:hypothetical protein
LVAVGAATLLAATPVHAQTLIEWSIPGHFLPNYNQRAKKCADRSGFPWVKWLSYANATVGSAWVITASSKTLCDTARKTSFAVIRSQEGGEGDADTNLSDMINYAIYRHQPYPLRAPKPAGRSWHCAILPSLWGLNAWTIGHGAVSDQTLAGASGVAAGAGYCARRKNGSYKRGPFFTWAPDTLTCELHYRLKEVPDPDFPGSTKPISGFPAQLWGDYDEIPC